MQRLQVVFLLGVGATLVATAGASAAPDHAKRGEAYLEYLSDCHKAHVCNGVYLVARNGEAVFEGAVGDSGDEQATALKVTDRFDIGSISKQFTAVAVLKLVAEGRLSLSDKVTTHFPTFPYDGVTIQDILSHTSGIPEVLPYYSSQLRRTPDGAPITGSDVISVLAQGNLPAESSRGTRYSYSNTGYIVLAALVEHVADQPFDVYLEQSFFKRLGMKSTFLRTPDNADFSTSRAWGFQPAPDGSRRVVDQLPRLFLRGAGGIYSTASDLLKWQNALNDGRVIPRRLYKLATTPARLLNGEEVPYGLGFSLKPDAVGMRRISHAGHWRAFKSDLSYFPDSRVTVIQLTNNSEDDSVDTNVSALAKIALGREVSPIMAPIGWDLVEKLDSEDIALVKSWFEQEMSAIPRRYSIEESDLNSIGYAYLNQRSTDKAETVFSLTALAFPRSANALDSLADAQEARGDIHAAHASIVAALAIEPNSEGLKKRAAVLRSRLP
ncbi:serine hydrolase domain-containing protein [Porphyrobacter sp. CACIAM 03H1]|uniref:serine hydrolase domain-containing protein n=1 Tax=Porphyrobacter sp. CACIAM 03H1 TaxID=2003315 RepID=UPI000B5A8A30|nr:serine hydrolase domain-containing protein [Porphyrobacter sp. CACIAM 03H1]ASJ91969.1 hypothetical protein CBR61_14225 [Porphyrobacter sp. CACIAM 03H1]